MRYYYHIFLFFLSPLLLNKRDINNIINKISNLQFITATNSSSEYLAYKKHHSWKLERYVRFIFSCYWTNFCKEVSTTCVHGLRFHRIEYEA